METVVIALPGKTFSTNFIQKWTETVLHLLKKGYDLRFIHGYSSFVPFSRMKTLGLDVLRGSEQKPFDGKLEYDVWLTIDSDIAFTPDDVVKLIENTKKYPVVSGMYRMEDLKHYAIVENWDEEYFKENGNFKFLTPEDVQEDEQYINVAYAGMGFFACRKDVIESLKYPYFSYPLIEIEGEDGKVLRDMCSEDVAFCKNLKDAGYKIIVNTCLRVGHEKVLVI